MTANNLVTIFLVVAICLNLADLFIAWKKKRKQKP